MNGFFDLFVILINKIDASPLSRIVESRFSKAHCCFSFRSNAFDNLVQISGHRQKVLWLLECVSTEDLHWQVWTAWNQSKILKIFEPHRCSNNHRFGSLATHPKLNEFSWSRQWISREVGMCLLSARRNWTRRSTWWRSLIVARACATNSMPFTWKLPLARRTTSPTRHRSTFGRWPIPIQFLVFALAHIVLDGCCCSTSSWSPIQDLHQKSSHLAQFAPQPCDSVKRTIKFRHLRHHGDTTLLQIIADCKATRKFHTITLRWKEELQRHLLFHCYLFGINTTSQQESVQRTATSNEKNSPCRFNEQTPPWRSVALSANPKHNFTQQQSVHSLHPRTHMKDSVYVFCDSESVRAHSPPRLGYEPVPQIIMRAHQNCKNKTTKHRLPRCVLMWRCPMKNGTKLDRTTNASDVISWKLQEETSRIWQMKTVTRKTKTASIGQIREETDETKTNMACQQMWAGSVRPFEQTKDLVAGSKRYSCFESRVEMESLCVKNAIKPCVRHEMRSWIRLFLGRQQHAATLQPWATREKMFACVARSK